METDCVLCEVQTEAQETIACHEKSAGNMISPHLWEMYRRYVSLSMREAQAMQYLTIYEVCTRSKAEAGRLENTLQSKDNIILPCEKQKNMHADCIENIRKW
jgi:hypothetical protein